MENRPIIVAVTSRKGGVGKTVSTALLARYLTEVEGKCVVVVDLDARGGITSLLHDQPISKHEKSIVEILSAAHQQEHVRDLFTKALIETGLEKSKHWEDNGGSLFLLPSKPSLDSVLSGKPATLLRPALHSLELPEEHVILIDTGSNSISVQMGIAAADIVFLPLKYSRQDVHPAVETLRTIVMEQRGNGRAVLGGLVVNGAGDTQWEAGYENKFKDLFDRFRQKTGFVSATDDPFIHLRQSRLIQRGTYMDWSLRDDFFETGQKMADAVHAKDSNIKERADG
jgi:cellulose biosynthesis protein BcsQ